MWDKTNRGTLWVCFAALAGTQIATPLVALGQGIRSESRVESCRAVLPHRAETSTRIHAFSPFSPVQPPMLDEKPITPGRRLRWFMASTVGPAHVVGVAFISATGTAVNRPEEYGSHWKGFADRLAIGVAGSAAGNAIEASAGLLLQEDPRYFRVSQSPFRSRVQNVVELTFLARGGRHTLRPAYARYAGIVGSNFLSNAWRAHSEANAQSALLRSSEGFAGRMAANAFTEFWPDVRKHVFHKRSRTVGKPMIMGIERTADR